MKTVTLLFLLSITCSAFANQNLCLQNVIEQQDLRTVKAVGRPQNISRSKDFYVTVDYTDDCSYLYRCRADENFKAYFADNTCGGRD